MAFAPKHVPNFDRKILSIYTSAIPINQGAFVDIDVTDTSLIAGTLGQSALSGGNVVLATVATASSSVWGRELGISVMAVTATGPSIVERILELSNSYMTLPEGVGIPIYIPASGDIVATDQFVGAVSGDSSTTGYLNPALQANLGAPCGIYQGKLRLAQSGDAFRARYMGQTTISGVLAGMFQFS